MPEINVKNSGPSFDIVTLGCPLNQYESAAIEGLLLKHGFNRRRDKSDVVIINSCAVTQAAARRSRKEARQVKKKNPNAVLVLTGCYSQLYPKDIEKLVPEADIVVGTAGRSKLPEIILQKLEQKGTEKQVLIQQLHKGERFEEFDTVPKFYRHRPVIKIQEGCNQFCSFCAVIFARGKPRSRDPEKIIEEARAYAASGYREIIITGTNMGLYGTDLENINLPKLLKKIDALNYPFRIRLSSIEPMGVTEELLEVMAKSRRICHYLYMPLQSGSSRILKLMGRNYTVEDYREIVEKARKFMPDISIMTDIIVGFPGERDEDHRTSMETLQSLEISKIHVFPYSPRPGTPAETLKEQVRPDIKKQRVEEMNCLSEDLSMNFHKKLLGRKLEVLVEKTYKENNSSFAEGFSESYALVRFKFKNQSPVGEIVPVAAEKAHPWGIEGSISYN